MQRFKFFRRLDGKEELPPPVLSVLDVEYGFAELIQRLAFTVIGAIMLWWSWLLLEPQISAFPNVDWLAVIVAVFTLLLGLRNAISLFKGLTWGQVFLTLIFVAVNAYLIWFA